MRLSSGDVSQLLGWSYFACWSLSFYPQFLLNLRTRRTDGLSPDFSWLNVLGFACYAMFNGMMYWNARVKHDSAQRHAQGLVQLNDVFFAVHALVLTFLTLAQIYWYAWRRNVRAPPVHLAVKLFLLVCVLVVSFTGRLAWERDYVWEENESEESYWDHNAWTWLGWCLLLSYIKLCVTLIKYFPQAVLNCARKSTRGWSIGNVLLDLAGGVLSLAQLAVDSHYTLGSLSHVLDNPVKLFLAAFSIGFDLLFIVQHYVLFPHHHDDDDAEYVASVMSPSSPTVHPWREMGNNNNNTTSSSNSSDEAAAVMMMPPSSSSSSSFAMRHHDAHAPSSSSPSPTDHQLHNDAVMERAAIPAGRRRAPSTVRRG